MRLPEAYILFKRAIRFAADDDVRLQAEIFLDHYSSYPRRGFNKVLRILGKAVKRIRKGRLLEFGIGMRK